MTSIRKLSCGLVNFLGRQKQPLIFDMNRDEEVWNYPIYEYEYTSEELSESEAVERLNLGLQEWIFNDASSLIVTTTISYRKAETGFANAGTKPAPTRKTYEYILELDDNDLVLGGEWVGESRNDHPDFLWMAFEPVEPTGSAAREILLSIMIR